MKCVLGLGFFFTLLELFRQNPWWFYKYNYASKTALLMIWLILLTGGQNVVKPCWLKLAFSSLNCVCSKGIVWQLFLSMPMPASAVAPPCRLSLGYGFALWLIQHQAEAAEGSGLTVALLHFSLPSAGGSDSCQLTWKAVVTDNLAEEGFFFSSFSFPPPQCMDLASQTVWLWDQMSHGVNHRDLPTWGCCPWLDPLKWVINHALVCTAMVGRPNQRRVLS